MQPVIAIIPARGGSKRIPGKNLVEVAGKPLLVWTIESALATRLLDRVFVSTEDPQIAQVAQDHGAEVLVRPASLAGDKAGTESALLHGLDLLWQNERIIPEAVTLLQCTSPLRGPELIDKAISLLLDTGCDAVVGVHPTIDYFFCGEVSQGHFVTSYDPQQRPRTQDITPRYRENGSLYVTRTSWLQHSGCRMGGDMRALIMDAVDGLDIDDLHDLALARHHLRQRLNLSNTRELATMA